MNQEPVISVITTIYNTEEYFERCYESILKQTYKSIQFIIVNNGSDGDIDKNIEKFISNYNNYDIKYVKLKENIGTFHGKLKGAEVATGDYITFIDSDDRVSVDYYRMMVTKAEEAKCDIIISDFVYEDENKMMTYDAYNYIQGYEFELNGKEIFDSFYKQAAHSYFWNLVWNKVYSVELWRKAEIELNKNKKTIVMCDDIAYTFVLFFYAKKVYKLKNTYYYYFKHSKANSNPSNVKKIDSIVDDIINVFKFCESFINNVNYDLESLTEWKERYARMWIEIIEHSKFSYIDKNKLTKKLAKALVNEESIDLSDVQDDYICVRGYNRMLFDDTLENIKAKLIKKSYKIVSFDIFDTLLVRHVWEPHDLFYFLDYKLIELLNLKINIEFHKIRQQCEQSARIKAGLNGFEEITIDEIYAEIYNQYGFDKDSLEKIKKYEMELELQLCEKREMVYNIYEMCTYLNKEIIYVSDMYLPKNLVYKLLEKNQYDINNKIFLSSEHKVTKVTSKMYLYILKSMNISSKEWIHIGDNMHSDIIKAEEAGIESIYIPRTIDSYILNPRGNFETRNEFIEMYNNNVGYNLTIFNNIGSRCLNALAVNKYMDNPYIFARHTYSGMNLYYIGYQILGLYIFAAANWIRNEIDIKKYDSITFLSRDGYVIKQAFNILFENYKSKYFYVSRKAILALCLSSKEDVLGIGGYIYFKDYSPKKIIKIFSNSIKYREEEVKDICEKNGFKLEVEFTSQENFNKFLVLFRDNIFCEESNNIYRNKMKKLFAEYFEKNCTTFDIGYSGRTESILNKLLGYEVDALFLYKNHNRSEINSKIGGFNISNLYEYFPNINEEVILEILISETTPSCSHYNIKNDKLEFIFNEKASQSYITNYFINILQKGSLDFIKDVKRVFGSLIEQNFYYNVIDLSFFMHFYIYKTPINELSYLENAVFEDSLSYGKTIKINDLIKNACNHNFIEYNHNNFNINNEKSGFKRLMFYILFDRNTLKNKIDKKTSKHSIFNKIIKLFYNLTKNIYRLIRRK